jgi:hypothetical protein
LAFIARLLQIKIYGRLANNALFSKKSHSLLKGCFLVKPHDMPRPLGGAVIGSILIRVIQAVFRSNQTGTGPKAPSGPPEWLLAG